MSDEADIQNRIRIRAGERGIILMRNNNGMFQDKTGRWVRFGLMNDSKAVNAKIKSSDLIGIWKGIFIACEVKESGWTRPRNDHERAQEEFLVMVNKYGGLGFFASSVKDFDDVIDWAERNWTWLKERP